MKTIYLMWNYDSDEALFASEDKGLVQEMMYDFMIDDAQFTYGWAYHINNYNFPHPAEIIEDELEYYHDYITIIEIPVVN